MGKLNLFDDCCDDEDPNINDIKIDHEYARRFEYNRQREASHRLEELKKSDDFSDSSGSDYEPSSGSDVEEDIPKRKEVKFFEVLSKIKNKDPILKNADAKLFDDSESDEDDDLKKEKKKKPKYLSQVLAEQLIKYGAEGLGSDEDGGDDMVKRDKVKSFDEEQQELVKAVLDATKEAEKEGEDGDDLLKEKVKEDVMDDEEDDEEEQERIRKIDEALGGGENEDEMFLKNFFVKRMWVGGNNDGEGLNVDDVEEVERQEEYEHDFNLRHEENAGDRVMGHSRFVEGSVRKKDTKRKEEKERQKMRREQLKAEKKEEVKHLKNLMKKEINRKIQMIQKISGIKEGLDASFVEEDFDPETHDEKMNELYNDEFYEAEDPELRNEDGEDEEDDIEKPDFDEEDKLLGLTDDWDEIHENPDSKDKKFDKEDHLLALPNKSGRGFTEARQKVLKLKAEKSVDNEEAEAAIKEIRDKCMEEYYGLEFEDVVGGDVKTRFRYRPVKPKRFGLSDTDILLADEKLLNQVVPLKKIAPYRETEWKVNRTKVLGVRNQIREIPKRKQTDAVISSGIKFNGIGEKRKPVAENPEVPQDNEVHGETSNPSRRAKRRRKNQSGLKLPHERLLAYGVIPSKPKKGKK